jgi:hypothetical protein
MQPGFYVCSRLDEGAPDEAIEEGNQIMKREIGRSLNFGALELGRVRLARLLARLRKVHSPAQREELSQEELDQACALEGAWVDVVTARDTHLQDAVTSLRLRSMLL